MRLHSVSVYNPDADCLWLSEGALGPDEHSVLIEAIETLKTQKSQPYHELGMEDGRIAIFLSIRAPRGDLVGTVMILADMKSVADGTMERILTPAVRTVLQKIAVYLHKLNPQATQTGQTLAMPTASSVTPLNAGTAPTLAASAKNSPARGESLAPKQVDEILTLELVAEAPSTEKNKAPAPGGATATGSMPAFKGGPAAKAAPAGAALKGNAGATASRGTSASRPAFQKAPAVAATPAAAPLPEIEVLAFDPSVSVPVLRAPAAPVHIPESEILEFDAHVEIPTAHPAPAEPPSVEIEMLAFDLEPNIAAPRVAPAPAPKAAPAPILSAPPFVPTTGTKPAAKTAKSSSADAVLINDTGKMPKLESFDETTTIEPALVVPAALPREPMSAADTAQDLTLHVQELIKLRSSGRTRRYEVLARSQRDAGHNEVPPAFLAESAKGREGAALDALVVERLLKWLGEHGETVWDSEPASFSVNLSIGALEDATFLEKVAQWLQSTGVPAEHIGFEITEFACVQCRPQVQRFIEACEKLGCFVVIDNFSFDSDVFEFLGSKALRHVKIDAKLTAAAIKDKLPQALVVAILQACKVLGVHCVAKRIESQSALQWLTAVGCDFAQGFALEKPTSLESLASGRPIQGLRETT